MHEAMAQGPALLAYNSGVFQDDDFKSLSSLGDSLKFSDGSKTGKFGRGFNTVCDNILFFDVESQLTW
jgi:hypothetical protein